MRTALAVVCALGVALVVEAGADQVAQGMQDQLRVDSEAIGYVAAIMHVACPDGTVVDVRARRNGTLHAKCPKTQKRKQK